MNRPRLYNKPQVVKDLELPLELDGDVGTKPSNVAELVCRENGCNRPSGHDGPHQVVRARDFAVLREWQ